MLFRERGKNALKSVLKNTQNIETFEKYIYDYSSKFQDEENIYIESIYDVINDISSEIPLKDILINIKNAKLKWSNVYFNDMITDEIDQDNFIKNPFEIEEGVLECNCGSKKVFSYQKQSRSADEPMSTYATCIKCKAKWIYSG
jgi:DNA-directed RNA polymerase subunit M/transcription elongation factor TFIIS